jgi:tagaturonate reductase
VLHDFQREGEVNVNPSSALPRLTRTWLGKTPSLPSSVTCGGLERLPEKVLQFGAGNFLRGFADWMFDLLNEAGLFGGSVVAVEAFLPDVARALNAQDGLYTLILRGVSNGQLIDRRRIITAVSRAINPRESWEALVRCFQSPALRFAVSNTTEAGISLVNEPLPAGQAPASFPAQVAALLYERFQAFRGDPARGLVFLPCELIDRNGATLRQYVLEHAQRWKLGSNFAAWVSGSQRFLNTLVDRIVPGRPGEEAGQFAADLGYEDALLDTGEVFHLWVIEGPPALAEELPFHGAGLNVVWTNDLTPYRTRKVRILNGAHTASVLAAFHGGLNTVRELVTDSVFGRFVRRAVFDEILPTVPLPAQERTEYAHAVLERFENPFVRHALLSISLNSVSKWKVRVLPTLLDYVQARGTLPTLLTFSLAALLHFYRGERAGTTEGIGRRGAESYPIRDEAAVLDVLLPLSGAGTAGWPSRERIAALLAHTPLWGQDLNTVAGLADLVTAHLTAIERSGMRGAVEALLA